MGLRARLLLRTSIGTCVLRMWRFSEKSGGSAGVLGCWGALLVAIGAIISCRGNIIVRAPVTA